MAGALAGALALAVTMALAGCSSTGGPGGGTGTTSSSTPASTTTTAATAGLGSYVPLYPFDTRAAADAWQQSYRSDGRQPWHLDSHQTALSFAQWLGYSGIDTVLTARSDSSGAHVTVGGHVPDSTQTYTAAVIHLVRWGSGSDAPWEVVGTDDTTLTLDSPHYGATVSSPVTAGGAISGVDESIRVQAWVLGSATPVGVACCLPAGGDHSAWHEAVAFSAAPGTVLTLAASTGGHVAAVERFAVTGVRAAAGSTASTAACTGSAMLPVVAGRLQLPAPDSTSSVNVQNCGGGWARVQAVPSNLQCGKGGPCYNDEQVFLKDVAGSWTVVENGSGINCTSPQATPADVVPGCKALGLG